MDEGNGSQDGMEEVFKIDEAKIRGHVDQVVRQSVEETLNSLLRLPPGSFTRQRLRE